MPLTRRGGRLLAAGVAAAVVTTGAVVTVQVVKDPVVVRERCTATANGESFDLAPDQASNAALITAIAVRRGLPARAATIAIATAIQESKLRNIDYGDRDSVGLFQQRPSQGWGTVEQIMDPVYSTNAFYDGLVKVDGYETMEITAAAQQVQRSGFPQAYADHEPEGRAYASSLTGYSSAALDCRLKPVDVEAQQPGPDGLLPRADTVRQALLSQLEAELEGGDDPARLTLDAGDSDTGALRAWAVAHWAVASAATYDVVQVECGGLTWRRDQPGDGWFPLSEDAGDAAAWAEQPGRVAITVANA